MLRRTWKRTKSRSRSRRDPFSSLDRPPSPPRPLSGVAAAPSSSGGGGCCCGGNPCPKRTKRGLEFEAEKRDKSIKCLRRFCLEGRKANFHFQMECRVFFGQFEFLVLECGALAMSKTAV